MTNRTVPGILQLDAVEVHLIPGEMDNLARRGDHISKANTREVAFQKNAAARHMTLGELAAFIVYSLAVAFSVGSMSEIWGSLQSAAGASERFELPGHINPSTVLLLK